MMFPIVLSTLLTLPIVQMCIGMIPPEDVSVGTISATLSTTQASPITTTQCTASSCPSTTTAVRVTPVTVTTATVTMVPTLCTTCDIAAIAPVMEANTVFENTNTVGADGCTQTNAICRRTDDQATNAAGTSTISSAMNANQVSGSLTCQADGTYSSGSVTGITKLICTFDTCVPACASCDIEATKPLMDPPGTVFGYSDSTPDGQTCKSYVVACFYFGNLCATINFYAEIGTGGEQVIDTMTNSNGAKAEVDCGNDAKLTFMGMGPIVRFRCEYIGCT
ncbi:hypothetical protein CRE_30209 [Caenorhabditis remanei]|uniref:DUF281 domain-containing protein n=1 Tax=Caenorhabditis remanei TaxID=31234 RepID=E3NGM1_CAERE|nr:hypothetical protein CRE_30209 [Caenorhabditis remanei]